MVCRTLPNYNWLEWVDKWNRKLPYGEAHMRPSTFSNSLDLDGRVLNHEKKFKFTTQETLFCKKWLENKGWVKDQPIACFMVRDSSFLYNDTHYTGLYGKLDSVASFHKYRDSDIKTYIPSMNWLTEKGVFVLRMGKIMEKPLNSTNESIIDYAFDSEKSDLLDIWLFSNCDYCISTGSGIDCLSYIYNLPYLGVNILPWDWKIYTTNVSISPKKLKFKDSNKYLNLKECIQHYYHDTKDYLSHRIIIEDLTADEILEDVKNFYAKHKKTRTLSYDDYERQKQVWKAISKYQKEPIIKNEYFHPECEFSYAWLRRQNEEFFKY